MYVLDTDTLSLLPYLDQYPNLRRNYLAAPPDGVYISIVTVQEQLKGALAEINRAAQGQRPQDRAKAVLEYAMLHKLVRYLALLQVLEYTPEAHAVFESFDAKIIRAGSQDCRIAAIAIANNFTVVTRNTRHFSVIPGVKIVDWTL